LSTPDSRDTPEAGSPDGAEGWSWDESLYAGSAAFYSVGRAEYPAELIDALVAELGLDGTGLLVDIGCGPGSLTLLLAPNFAEAIGVDADGDMLAEAARLADQRGAGNVTWRHARGEDLTDVTGVRTVTLAQSFHWMDRARVAANGYAMLAWDGALVHVHATTHQGVEGDTALPHPRPPWDVISGLVRRYLGPARRAGQGVRSEGTGGEEPRFYRAAGFTGPTRLTVPGRSIERSAEQIVAAVLSLSSSAPHLFGERLTGFTTELRGLLAEASPEGVFAEEMGSIDVDVWRKSG
jgi:SAM-dependent methyltransferase